MNKSEIINHIKTAEIFKISWGKNNSFREETRSSNKLIFRHIAKYYDAFNSKDRQAIDAAYRTIKSTQGESSVSCTSWNNAIETQIDLKPGSLILNWNKIDRILLWGVSGPGFSKKREEFDEFNQKNYIFEKPLLHGWQNMDMGDHPLLLSGIHPRAQHFVNEQAVLSPIKNNAEYFRALILDGDTTSWESQPDWEKAARQKGWKAKPKDEIRRGQQALDVARLAVANEDHYQLSSEELSLVGADHIFRAVQRLLDDPTGHTYEPSADFDLVTDEGDRLPPQAVFALAATSALGRSVLPTHFTGGIGSPCFQSLRNAGYEIVPSGAEQATRLIPTSAEDLEWTEGRPKLVLHLKRERSSGLARAKKADFKRKNGRLRCEHCHMDPIETFGGDQGEACIEVHHRKTLVADMSDGHMSRIEDVECLCANCHRVVHRKLRDALVA